MSSALVIGRWSVHAFTRYVRTPAGAKRYKVPIGSPIPVGRRVRKKKESGGGSPAAPSPAPTSGTPRVPLNPAQVDLAERHFGRASDTDGTDRGARLHPDGTLEVVDRDKARATLDRIAANPDTPPERRQAAQDLHGKIAGEVPDTPAPESVTRPIGRKVKKRPVEPARPAERAPETPTTPPRMGADELAADYEAKVGDLDSDEGYALARYTGGEFADMNQRLRDGQPPTDADTDRGIDAMQRLASRYQTPERVEARRYVDADAIPDSIKPGDTFTEPGFSSTTLRDDPPSMFTDKPVEMTIDVPKGSDAIIVNGTHRGVTEEQEMILSPGTQYQVTSDEVGADGQRKVRVTAIPPVVETPPEMGPLKEAELEAAYRDASADAPYTEREALSDYLSVTGFTYINGVLRGDPPPMSPQMRERVDANITELERAANRYQIPDTVTVYRRVGDGVIPDGAQPGDVISPAGFHSASMARDGPATWQSMPVVMQITVPKGSNAIVVGGREHEMILPHGTRFRVVAEQKKGGARWVTLQALPPAEATSPLS
jgi:ADP-ribosyltransferase exoenzyme